MKQARPVWPEHLLQWFQQVKRNLPWRNTKDPYAIWVSEVMLQQTQVKTVIPYYDKFLERFSTVQSLAEAELDEVLEMWRGLGYYSRARHLWEGARFVVEHCEGQIPENYEHLLRIPGVGEYTAGAIASIAYNECVPAIDGNVNRVLARLIAWEEPTAKVKSRRVFQEVLKEAQPSEAPGDFNQALMELGATLCSPKITQCGECPLERECDAHRLGQELIFPVKQEQGRAAEAFRFTLMIKKGDRLLVDKRPSSGLLANLWEFPGEEILKQDLRISADNSLSLTAAESGELYGHMDQKPEERKKEKNSGQILNPEYWYNLYLRVVPERSQDEKIRSILEKGLDVKGPIYHTFSHRRWEMFWIIVEWPSELSQDGMHWVNQAELNKMALPVAFQKLLDELNRN